MTDRITTAALADLLDIFDPQSQEQESAGDARIIYTFNEHHSPIRNRVQDTFILDVEEPKISFFISAPIESTIEEGTILFAISVDGLDSEYSLSDIQQLVEDITLALGLANDDTISDSIK